MSQGLAKVAALLASAAAITVGTVVLRKPAVAMALPPRVHAASRPVEAPVPDQRIDSLLRRAADAAPFRAARQPPAVPFNPAAADEPAAPPPSSAPRPMLVLSGIVWGASPAAVLEGLPETEGPRVVRRLDRVGALTVRRIERDRVIVTGLDTTWTLRVREPWK